jgi:hypothetical protein
MTRAKKALSLGKKTGKVILDESDISDILGL